MDLGLEGKTALVLGAGGGLGSAIALSLACEGVSVALADINAEALDRTVQTLQSSGGRCLAVAWDLADLSIIPPRFDAIHQAFGTVDILVNNTGGPPPSLISGLGDTLWLEHFRKMVQPVIAITDHALPYMREKQWGRVITSASSGVVAPIPNLGVSNALRSTLVGWSKTLAREVAADGITANIVVPGRIATDRIQFLDRERAKRESRTVEAVAEQSTASIPVGRYGRPEEYADVVTFLASRRASYVTGSIIRVDGGFIAGI